jgi:hypothetical protein
MSKAPPFGDGMTPAEKNVAYNYRSKVDRMEGQIEALLQTVYDHARKIELLEDKNRLIRPI